MLTVFLCIRRDFKEFLYLRLPTGLVLYALVAGSWYYMMYTIHGMDFINKFLGVHNFLRATQSEHPRWDVWWYYTMIFFAGCLPWCWTFADLGFGGKYFLSVHGYQIYHLYPASLAAHCHSHSQIPLSERSIGKAHCDRSYCSIWHPNLCFGYSCLLR